MCISAHSATKTESRTKHEQDLMAMLVAYRCRRRICVMIWIVMIKTKLPVPDWCCEILMLVSEPPQESLYIESTLQCLSYIMENTDSICMKFSYNLLYRPVKLPFIEMDIKSLLCLKSWRDKRCTSRQCIIKGRSRSDQHRLVNLIWLLNTVQQGKNAQALNSQPAIQGEEGSYSPVWQTLQARRFPNLGLEI